MEIHLNLDFEKPARPQEFTHLLGKAMCISKEISDYWEYQEACIIRIYEIDVRLLSLFAVKSPMPTKVFEQLLMAKNTWHIGA